MRAAVQYKTDARSEERPEPARGGSLGLGAARADAGRHDVREPGPQTSFRTGLARAEECIADRETTQGSCRGERTMAQRASKTRRDVGQDAPPRPVARRERVGECAVDRSQREARITEREDAQLLRLVARANANVAELMRLSDFVPKIFYLEGDDARLYDLILQDYAYFQRADLGEEKLMGTS